MAVIIEEIHSGNGFAIIRKDNQYTIEWPQGPFDQVISYPIDKKLADKALKSEQDAYEVMMYVKNENKEISLDNSESERKENLRKFIKQFPELLIKVPDNQNLFNKDELEKLLPLANKRISKGK